MINFRLEQMLLFDDMEIHVPDRAYVVLLYKDSDGKKSEVGDIFFVLPSKEEKIIFTARLDSVLDCYSTIQENASPSHPDDIDLPSKSKSSEIEKIS